MSVDWARQRVLILAPHPDDEVLGCGGLMSRVKDAGGEVYVHFLTVGDTADISPAGLSTAEQRLHEVKQVADLYRWDGWGISFPGDEYHLRLDTLPRFELAGAIERDDRLGIAALRPTVVLLPHRSSYNQDHQAVNDAAVTALRPADRALRHHPDLVLAYEEAADQWRAEATPPPNLFAELSETHLAMKLTAMALYGSQAHEHPHTRSELTLRSLAALRGMQNGTAYAEAFHLLRCHA
ncbi:MAG: PIG-L family deacetylase [Streptosporangiales bacterium]|nr:PIG-L family deacetylase [Streptosporangiales bacterium]